MLKILTTPACPDPYLLEVEWEDGTTNYEDVHTVPDVPDKCQQFIRANMDVYNCLHLICR